MSPDLPLLPIVSQFGKYLKVIVVLEETVPDAASTSEMPLIYSDDLFCCNN